MSDSDPRPMLFRAFDQASRLVGDVSAAQLRLPTPCTEFDVSALLRHLVGVGNRIASVGRGEPQTGPLALPEVNDDGWAAAFDASRQQAISAWADDAVLERKAELPFGTFDGATVAAIYLMELTTHTWDLAQATGRVATLDEQLAAAALPIARQMLPVEPRGGFIPFEAVVAVAPGASAYQQLAGFLGRAVD